MEITATTRRLLEPAGVSELPGEARAALGAAGGGPRQDVMDLVVRQPEEIAILLRSWLADRRTDE
jgi:hypothetical protein